MSKKWEKLEQECQEYLKEEYEEYALFELRGSSNSNDSDIDVKLKKYNSLEEGFQIEVKSPNAQSGQFVLFPDYQNRTFTFSEANKSSENYYSRKIVEYMSQNFDTFKNPGTRGKDINFQGAKQIFSNWIISHYKEKNVKFIMTKEENGFIIFPLEKFTDFYDVTAKYRHKKSGSKAAPKREVEKISQYLMCNFRDLNIKYIDKKIIAYSEKDFYKYKFYLDNSEYIFSKKDGYYEVRKLSNTNNPNVIFEISLKPNKKSNWCEFEEKIKKQGD